MSNWITRNYPKGLSVAVDGENGEIVNYFTEPFSQAIGGIIVRMDNGGYQEVETSYLDESGPKPDGFPVSEVVTNVLFVNSEEE